MNTRARKRQALEDQFYNLEVKMNCLDELNEENVEEATLNYANNVAKSEVLVEKALEEKSIKSFNIDSRICQNIASFSNSLTQFVRTENKIFNPKLFAEKLVTYYNPGARVENNNERDEQDSDDEIVNRGFDLEDLCQLGKQLSNIISELPAFNFAYGSFKPEINEKALAKAKKDRKKRTDFTTDTTTKPQNYEEANGKDDDVVIEEIEHLHKEITEKTKQSSDGYVDFYDAIIDKDCLTSSVTNIFHSAFMVKEGMLKIELKNGRNIVRPSSEEESNNVTELPRRQQVLRFNKTKFDRWRAEHGDE